MRLILILVWLSVSAAQDDDDATTNWLLQVLNNQETGKHQETDKHQDTGKHQDTDKYQTTKKPKELGNRFDPSQIQTNWLPQVLNNQETGKHQETDKHQVTGKHLDTDKYPAQDDEVATTNWLLQVLNNQETGKHQETDIHQVTGKHQDTDKYPAHDDEVATTNWLLQVLNNQETGKHQETDKHQVTGKHQDTDKYPAHDDEVATTNWLLQVLNNQETGKHQETDKHQVTGKHQDTGKHPAQDDEVAPTNWLLQVLKIQETGKHHETDKHQVSGKHQDKELGNRFDPSQIQNPLLPDVCTLSTGEEGLCVNPLYCAVQPEPSDPTTRFIYREALCPITLICCPINSINDEPDPPKTLPTVCGVSNPGGHNFQISNPKSDFSKFAEFPWMVALLTPQHSSPWKENEYIGGGSLIHPSVVLSVAHKLDRLSPSQIKCRAGEWDKTNAIEILPHQDRNVREIVLHNNFEKAHARYDAALLFLESPFDLQGVYHIGVACLAPDLPAPGTLCYSMGWGKTLKDTYATTLKKIQLPLVDDATCTSQLRRTALGPTYHLHSTLLCAGGEEGVDTCTGDGGSSLVCPLPSYKSLNRFAVYGMVVYGMGCGVRDVPGVYAKVPSMYDWVNRKMEEHQLTKTYVI